jgi:hypothetical protein
MLYIIFTHTFLKLKFKLLNTLSRRDSEAGEPHYDTVRRPTKNCQNQAKTPETLQVTENPKESSVNIYNVVMI